ncbi:MAG: hypothetical protein WDA18_08400 [Candidatus Ratteibacteria bacterium]
MNIGKVKKYMVYDYSRKTSEDFDSGETSFLRDNEFQKKFFAFTSLAYNPIDGFLYCGMTNFGNDLLYRFDPVTKALEGMGYADASFGDRFDIKLHRSVEIDSQGVLYCATSCLHNVDQRLEGTGGKVFTFDPSTKKYELLSIPKKYDYIQTISLDEKRKMVYGFTYPVFEFFAFSLEKKDVVFSNYMASIPHISAVDDRGGYWGTWGQRMHKLFRYNPETNNVTYYAHGFPEGCQSLMYPNAGPIDSAINGGDGFLYFGTELGILYRLNPANGELEFLGKPFPGIRMPGLIAGDDGLLYMVGGADRGVFVAAYDRNERKFFHLGAVQEEEGAHCFRPHDIEKIGNMLYIGETDHPTRTCYLWECTLNP